jgi:uncharacterized protein (DUF885 family)
MPARQIRSVAMNVIRILLATLLILIGNSANAAATEEFAALLDDAWEWQLRQDPVMASSLGIRRYNERWQDASLAAIESAQEQQREFMRRLLAIDSLSLSPDDQLNYDLYRRDLMTEIEGFQFRNYLMPVSQRGGVQTLDDVTQSIPLSTLTDFEDWLKRMAAVDRVIDQTIAVQEEGRKQSGL